MDQVVSSMLVRLVGDATSYRQTLADAVSATRVAVNEMVQIGSKLTAALTVPIAIMGRVAVKSFKEFDAALTESAAIMYIAGQSAEEFAAQTDRLSNVALDLSTRAVQGPTALAKAYYYLSSAGKSAEQSMNLLPTLSDFAAAGVFNLARATELALDAQISLGLSSRVLAEDQQQLTRVGDVLIRANTLANATAEQFSQALTNNAAPAARQFGIQLEEVVSVLAVYAERGIKGAKAGSDFARAIRLMSTAAVRNADQFTAMGIAVFNTDGRLRPIADIIENMTNVLSRLSPEVRTAALEQLGFAALSQRAILPLLGSADAMREFQNQLNQAGGFQRLVAERQLASFSNQLQILKNQLEVVAIEIGKSLAPALRGMIALVSSITMAWRSLDPAMRTAVLGFAIITASIGPLFIVFHAIGPGLVALTHGFEMLLAPIHLVTHAFFMLINPLTYLGIIWVTIKTALLALGATLLTLLNPLALIRIAWAVSFGPAAIVAFTLLKVGAVIALLVHRGYTMADAWQWLTTTMRNLLHWLEPVGQAFYDLSLTIYEVVANALVHIGEETLGMVNSFLRATGALEVNWTDIWTNIRTTVIEAIHYVEGAIANLWRVTEIIVHEIEAAWEAIWPTIEGLFNDLVDYATRAWEEISTSLSPILTEVLRVLNIVLLAIAGTIGGVILLVIAIIRNFDSILTGTLAAGEAAATGLSNALSGVGDWFTYLGEQAREFWSWLLQLQVGLGALVPDRPTSETLRNAMGGGGADILSLGDATRTFETFTLQGVIDQFHQLGGSSSVSSSSIIDSFNTIVQFVTNTLVPTIGTLISWLGGALVIAIEIVGKVIEGATTIIRAFTYALSSVVWALGKVVSWFGWLIESAGNAGASLLDPAFSWFPKIFEYIGWAIKNVGELIAWVAQLFNALADAVLWVVAVIGRLLGNFRLVLTWLYNLVRPLMDLWDQFTILLGSIGAVVSTTDGLIATLVSLSIILAVVHGGIKLINIAYGILRFLMAITGIQLVVTTGLTWAYQLAVLAATAAISFFNVGLTLTNSLMIAGVAIGVGIFVTLGGVIWAAWNAVEAFIGAMSQVEVVSGPIRAVVDIFQEWIALAGEFVTILQVDVNAAWQFLQASFALGIAQVQAMWEPLWTFILAGFEHLGTLVGEALHLRITQALANTRSFVTVTIHDITGGLLGESREALDQANRGVSTAITSSAATLRLQLRLATTRFNEGVANADTAQMRTARNRIDDIRHSLTMLTDAQQEVNRRQNRVNPPAIEPPARPRLQPWEDLGEELGGAINRGVQSQIGRFDASLRFSAEALSRIQNYFDAMNTSRPGGGRNRRPFSAVLPGQQAGGGAIGGLPQLPMGDLEIGGIGAIGNFNFNAPPAPPVQANQPVNRPAPPVAPPVRPEQPGPDCRCFVPVVQGLTAIADILRGGVRVLGMADGGGGPNRGQVRVLGVFDEIAAEIANALRLRPREVVIPRREVPPVAPREANQGGGGLGGLLGFGIQAGVQVANLQALAMDAPEQIVQPNQNLEPEAVVQPANVQQLAHEAQVAAEARAQLRRENLPREVVVQPVDVQQLVNEARPSATVEPIRGSGALTQPGELNRLRHELQAQREFEAQTRRELAEFRQRAVIQQVANTARNLESVVQPLQEFGTEAVAHLNRANEVIQPNADLPDQVVQPNALPDFNARDAAIAQVPQAVLEGFQEITDRLRLDVTNITSQVQRNQNLTQGFQVTGQASGEEILRNIRESPLGGALAQFGQMTYRPNAQPSPEVQRLVDQVDEVIYQSQIRRGAARPNQSGMINRASQSVIEDLNSQIEAIAAGAQPQVVNSGLPREILIPGVTGVQPFEGMRRPRNVRDVAPTRVRPNLANVELPVQADLRGMNQAQQIQRQPLRDIRDILRDGVTQPVRPLPDIRNLQRPEVQPVRPLPDIRNLQRPEPVLQPRVVNNQVGMDGREGRRTNELLTSAVDFLRRMADREGLQVDIADLG